MKTITVMRQSLKDRRRGRNKETRKVQEVKGTEKQENIYLSVSDRRGSLKS